MYLPYPRQRNHYAVLAGALVTGLFIQPTAASASDRPATEKTIIRVEMPQVGGGPASELKIALPSGTSTAATDSVVAQLAKKLQQHGQVLRPVASGSLPHQQSAEPVAGTRSIVLVAQPTGDAMDKRSSRSMTPDGNVGSSGNPPHILCVGPGGIQGANRYTFSDGDGTFGVRNNCPYNAFNWDYKISSAVRSFIVGAVHEGGMGWSKNGVGQGIASGHYEPSDYLFHGTWPNVNTFGDVIQYEDHFFFSVNIGGRTGSGSVTIYGYLQATFHV